MLDVHTNLAVKGNAKITIRDAETGEIRRIVHKKNLVVNSGKQLIAQSLAGNASAWVTHIAIGTGTTVPAATDTSLEAETFRKSVDSTVDGATVTFAAFIGSQEYVGDISELGLFIDGDNINILLSRVVITTITKTNTEVADIVWEITIQ